MSIVTPHPLGVRPEGNILFDAHSKSHRQTLGFFSKLNDSLIIHILENLSYTSLGCLMQTNQTFYAFCSDEDLWAQLVATHYNGRFSFNRTWKLTFRDCWYQDRGLGPRNHAQPVLVQTVYSDLLFQRWLCTSTPIRSRWLRRESIPRIDVRKLEHEEFLERFVRARQPVILTGLVDQWPASRLWSREYLLSKAKPDAVFEAGTFRMSLGDFFKYADTNRDESPAFIFDPTFAEKIPGLEEDYRVPEFLADDLFSLLPERPNYRWILLGNKRSGSKWHVDPNQTHAWNAVIRGAKRWFFFPPGRAPPGVYPSPDGAEVAQPVSLMEWLLNFYKSAAAVPDPENPGARLILEATCREGELMFIPRGWWHAVLNLHDDTFALTQNSVTPEICDAVSWFLKNRPEQVSGVSEERRPILWKEFEEALEKHRPSLARLHSKNTLVSHADVRQKCDPSSIPPSIHGAAASALCQGKETANRVVLTADSDTRSSDPSFWDKLKQSNRKIVVGNCTSGSR